MKYLVASSLMMLAAPAMAATLPAISYTVVKSGPASTEHPSRKSAVEVRYEGTFTDGKVFDGSKDKTVIFPLGRLIPGWVAVVPLMKRGDVWNVTLPPQFAYGAAGSGETIPPNSTLKFRIELVDFADMPPQPFEPITKLPGR